MKQLPRKQLSIQLRLSCFFCIAWLVLLVGCGKKGPPSLPDTKAPQSVTSLTVSQQGGDIVLKWAVAKAAEDEALTEGFQVYRSAEPVSEDSCEGCPVLFHRVAKVALDDMATETRTMVYREPLLPATRYRFKVIPYDAQGGLGPDSNIVRIITE